jgi:hypothetical protein
MSIGHQGEETIVRHLLIGLVILALAATACAGQNPNLRIFLDADPPNRVSRIDPPPNSLVDVYIVLDRFGPCDAGMMGTAFLFDRTFGGMKLAQTSMLGGIEFGDVEVDGWTLTSGVDCAYPDNENGIVVVGRVEYFYTGTPGTITLHPHPVSGRFTTDCDYMDDEYCIGGHFGVNQDPPEGEDCVYYSHVVTNPNVGIAMHVDSAGHDCLYALPDCALIDTYWPFTGELVNIFVIVCMHENGFDGMEYSMVWPPEWNLYGWESCADYDSDFFFYNGDGIRQCWHEVVPAGQPKVVGVLTLLPTTPGRVYVWTHPMTQVAAVYKGNAFDEVLPWDTYGNGRAGWVDVVSGPGCNPCFCVNPDPCWPDEGTEVSGTVLEGSWGSIKAMYK